MKYRNTVPREPIGFAKTAAISWRFFTQKPDTTVPRAPIPVQRLTAAALAEAPDASVYRLGHSTLLLKLNGGLWLTDPVFCERASPVQWAGPKRFHPPPIAIDELPPISACSCRTTTTTISTRTPSSAWRRRSSCSSRRWAWATG